MKTLQMIKKNGKFDLVLKDGKPVVLDSRVAEEKTLILEQRVVKAVLSKENNYDTDYGLNLTRVIGQKKGGNLVMLLEFDKLNTFFKKNYSKDKDCAIQGLDIEYNNDTIIKCKITGKKTETQVTFGEGSI